MQKKLSGISAGLRIFKKVKFEQSHLIGWVTWLTQFLTVK